MDEADRQRLAVVRRSAQRLKGLVDDLLLNARAGEGRLTLSPVPTDVRTVVMDIAHAYRPAAVEKHLALRAAIAELPQAVLIDPLQIASSGGQPRWQRRAFHARRAGGYRSVAGWQHAVHFR